MFHPIVTGEVLFLSGAFVISVLYSLYRNCSSFLKHGIKVQNEFESSNTNESELIISPFQRILLCSTLLPIILLAFFQTLELCHNSNLQSSIITSFYQLLLLSTLAESVFKGYSFSIKHLVSIVFLFLGISILLMTIGETQNSFNIIGLIILQVTASAIIVQSLTHLKNSQISFEASVSKIFTLGLLVSILMYAVLVVFADITNNQTTNKLDRVIYTKFSGALFMICLYVICELHKTAPLKSAAVLPLTSLIQLCIEMNTQ